MKTVLIVPGLQQLAVALAVCQQNGWQPLSVWATQPTPLIVQDTIAEVAGSCGMPYGGEVPANDAIRLQVPPGLHDIEHLLINFRAYHHQDDELVGLIKPRSLSYYCDGFCLNLTGTPARSVSPGVSLYVEPALQYAYQSYATTGILTETLLSVRRAFCGASWFKDHARRILSRLPSRFALVLSQPFSGIFAKVGAYRDIMIYSRTIRKLLDEWDFVYFKAHPRDFDGKCIVIEETLQDVKDRVLIGDLRHDGVLPVEMLLEDLRPSAVYSISSTSLRYFQEMGVPAFRISCDQYPAETRLENSFAKEFPLPPEIVVSVSRSS